MPHKGFNTLSVHLKEDDFYNLKILAAKNHVTLSSYIRAILLDALVEEGYALQRVGTPGRKKARETSEARGVPTS